VQHKVLMMNKTSSWHGSLGRIIRNFEDIRVAVEEARVIHTHSLSLREREARVIHTLSLSLRSLLYSDFMYVSKLGR